MIIDCIADLHGHYPELKGGDLLIVAGDCLETNSFFYRVKFAYWMEMQNYKKIVFIGGNHDATYEKEPPSFSEKTTYLCDSATEFEGLKIWGSPWTKTFKGMNPLCKAFTLDTEKELEEKWKLIPDDTDILITHCAPFEYGDETFFGEKVGSKSLNKEVWQRIAPEIHVFGHIHEGYGTYRNGGTLSINCSHVNEMYEAVNKPIRIERILL